ncbi:MAG: adenylosuccinate synthase, partial [Gammaproteobacteria bacterium]|nr:adenylosuccinate synthase [Gammaproteobacteria bacterium]
QVLDEYLGYAEALAPMVCDVTAELEHHLRAEHNLLFEGAQGALLDIDHGTYPYVTSSNTTAGAAATGTGIGPRYFDYVLGIVKAYTTRVGAGPFPTELFDASGEHMARVGAEFGATTGRPRRCGWFDAIAMRRSVLNNSVSGLAVTKLDVLDGLDTLKICVGYDIDGVHMDTLPNESQLFSRCEPVYETMPGWQEKTAGITKYEDLPVKARRYLERLSALVDRPLALISTGPDRDDTIILTDPFSA